MQIRYFNDTALGGCDSKAFAELVRFLPLPKLLRLLACTRVGRRRRGKTHMPTGACGGLRTREDQDGGFKKSLQPPPRDKLTSQGRALKNTAPHSHTSG